MLEPSERLERPTVGVVSTYPPTGCGIATYARSLVTALRGATSAVRRVEVVSLVDEPPAAPSIEVAYHHRRGDPRSLRTAAARLDRTDVVSVQHEFGIFAGRDGREVLDLVDALAVPAVVTMHTVLGDPTRRQRDIVRHLADRAAGIVVMSDTAATRLETVYGADPTRLEVIPHGVTSSARASAAPNGDRPLVLTWGLIGPGKGIETAIEAMVHVADRDPLPRYLVLGATHPVVRAREGERYRERLLALVDERGLTDVVEFDGRYLDNESLAEVVERASLVLLPYDAVEQVTSGVLVEALAAGRPVVATAFSHAEELLSDGAGYVVPHADPTAMGRAVRALLDDDQLAAGCAARARELSRSWGWPTIADRHAQLFATAVADRTGPSRVELSMGSRR
jgi:polysaccharide biosynthesis protein PslF